MSKILSGLKKATTSNTIKAAKAHIVKASEVVMTLRSAFEKVKERNYDETLKKFNAVSELEHQADQIRRSIILEIAGSEIEETVKEALMHLIKNVDKIANTANASARIFAQVPSKYFDMLMKDDESILKMLEKSVDVTKLLLKMVDELLATGRDIDKLNQSIQSIEHECDIHLSNIYRRLLTMENLQVPAFVAIQISAGLNYMEAISDSVEDTADYIKEIATIRKT
jgi:predicted phosphate transport protein (TIGR00153 family)